MVQKLGSLTHAADATGPMALCPVDKICGLPHLGAAIACVHVLGPLYNRASPAIETTQTPRRFNPTQAACCSRLVALALDEEGLHLLVLQDLHDRPVGSVHLPDREELLLRPRHHCAREVALVDRVVPGRHGPVQQWHDVAENPRRVGVAENHGLGVSARCCHDPAYTSASSPG